MLRTIVRCVLPDRPEVAPAIRREAAEEAIAFVADALRSAPLHIVVGERVFRMALWLWLLPVAHRAPIERGPTAVVERMVGLFAALSPPSASIVRLYRSLAMLAFLEADGMVRAVGHRPARERQAAFRQVRQNLLKDQPS